MTEHQDDPEAEALRKQIREEMGTPGKPREKKRMGPVTFIFTVLSLMSPLFVYLVIIAKAHDVSNPQSLMNWLFHP